VRDGPARPRPGTRTPSNLTRRPNKALVSRLQRAGILYPFIVLFIVLSVWSGPFATKVNLLDILDQQSSTLIIAAAGTLVLVAGGIDLSVGAVYALAGVTAAHLALFASPTVAIAAGIAVGLGRRACPASACRASRRSPSSSAAGRRRSAG
jgi:ribose/xylose/arabinose/galactoside ABC-type transport system permease subunit